MQHPPQPSSPFTNAPLHHRSNHVPYPQPGGQYPGYPYGYAPPGYPPYSTPNLPPFYQQPAQHSTTAGKAPASTPAPAAPVTSNAPAATGSKDGADKAEGHDANAWEAAQHILQAINFSALHGIGDAERPDAPLAEATATLPPSSAAAAGVEAAPRTTLAEDERAALQAQLALLAAQLTEIANSSEDEDEEEAAVALPQQPAELEAGVQLQHEPASRPEPAESGVGTTADGGQFPTDLSSEEAGRAMAMLLDNLDSAAQAMAREGEDEEEEDGEEQSDEDEDMEMVEVPTYVESDALRT